MNPLMPSVGDVISTVLWLVLYVALGLGGLSLAWIVLAPKSWREDFSTWRRRRAASNR